VSRDDRGDADRESASNGDAAFGAPVDEGTDGVGSTSGGDDAGFAAASNEAGSSRDEPPRPGRDEPGGGDDKAQIVAFAKELGVDRNVKWALALGAAFAALLYVVFVVVPAETTQSPALYLGLAFVVFFATSLSLAIVFTLISAWRRTQEL